MFFYFPLDCPTSILYQCKTDTILKKNKTKTKSLSFPFPLITKPSFKTQITVFSHNHLRKNPKQPNKKKFQNLLHQREMVKQRKKKKRKEKEENAELIKTKVNSNPLLWYHVCVKEDACKKKNMKENGYFYIWYFPNPNNIYRRTFKKYYK